MKSEVGFLKTNNEEVIRSVYINTIRLINEYGIKGWNMDDLARESGLAKNTLYKIIGNKEALIFNIIDDIWSRYYRYISSTIDTYDTKEVIGKFVEDLPEFISSFGITKLSGILKQYPSLKKMHITYLEKLNGLLREFYVNCKEEGVFKSDVDIDVMIYVENIMIDKFMFEGITKDSFDNDKIVNFYKQFYYGVTK